MDSTIPAEVKVAFSAYPPELRERLLELRRLVLETASVTGGAGEIEETLKWGEPAYLTSATRSGSTVRIAPVRGEPRQYGGFFNCQTSLVETFRHWFPRDLTFLGNRGIVFDIADPLPREAVTECVAAAFTYHRSKR